MSSKPKSFFRLPDAGTGNWVDRFAPLVFHPYLKAMRADRPIGIWLLMWPGFWSIAMAAGKEAASYWLYFLYFFIGAVLMRGAGCIINDIADSELDKQVTRTARRPIASGQISMGKAFFFAAVLSFLSFLILIQFNTFTIILGALSLVLIATYPFMKRITYWPQLFLGFTFNWGALLGWAAVEGQLSISALALYTGGIFWTLGYDTIYAHQDKEDDLLVGIKSTALKFGRETRKWLTGFYVLALTGFGLAGYIANLGWGFYAGLAFLFLHFLWQILRLRTEDAKQCLKLFKSNYIAGFILFLSVLLGHWT